MAIDLAINTNTGDLRIAPNKDFERVVGEATVKQRILVRLRIYQGEWSLDPTGGSLGSRLHEVVRLPIWRAEQEAGLVIREAIEPMEDVRVHDVQVSISGDTKKKLEVVITYAHIEPSGQSGDNVDLSTTLFLAG